ncbi:unnamed protein product [Caenorhabditis nigoni]
MSSNGTYLFWISVTHFVPKLGFVLTTTFGSILLFLNFFGAQKHFGTYKYLISAFTLLGMVFATVEIMVYPITAPTIILFIPITIIIFLPLFNFDFISVPSGVMLCSFTLYPASDSLIVMYVVSEYRNTAKRLIRKGLKYQNSQQTTSKVYATTVNPTSTAPMNG